MMIEPAHYADRLTDEQVQDYINNHPPGGLATERLLKDLLRARKLEAFILGERCDDNSCEDYDGGHPYHRSELVKRFEEGQKRARESLQSQLDYQKRREEHISKLIKVADSGRYVNDWDAAIERVVRERDAAEKAAAQFSQELNDKAAEIVLLKEQRASAERTIERLEDQLQKASQKSDKLTERLIELADQVCQLVKGKRRGA